ncbi:8435_t:CDS:1, partial [Cetraspora pellucida]
YDVLEFAVAVYSAFLVTFSSTGLEEGENNTVARSPFEILK